MLSVLVSAALSLPPPAAAATLPSGFSDDPVVSVGAPTDLAFTPDGRMLITTQPGRLRVVADGALLPTAALDLVAAGTVCSNLERGLLGVAVDPGFATNGFIYLYYTFKKSGGCETNTTLAPVNRVSKFTLSPPGNTIDPLSEVVLIDNIPSPSGKHNAGDLHVAADGLLYVTVGDGECKLGDANRCAGENDNSRFLDTLLGKILRIGLDGSIPGANPYAGQSDARRCGDPAGVPSGTGPCAETFASGLRNPFRFAFRPGTSEFHINDVGQATWEEIDLGLAGADYGWNVREGNCALGSTSDCGSPPAGMTNPIHVYGHSGGCQSITGGAFVPVGVWPSGFDNAYLFSDYICGKIFRLVPNASGGYDQLEFATALGSSSAVAMAFGPYANTQALYYTTYAGGGSVRRISTVSSTNQVPVANAGTAGTASGVPVAITLTGSDVETCNLTFNAPATTVAGGTLGATSPLACASGSPNTDSASVTYTPPGGGFTGPDSFTFTVHDGTDPSTPKTISITVGAAGGTATFGSAADAQVYSSKATTNYGTLASMRTREGTGSSSDPIYRSYLRFNVTGVSGTVSDVKLRLFVTDPSPNLQNVFAVTPDTWIESGAGGITYNTTPAIDTPATPLGGAPVPTAGWVEIDLANSAVSANGPLSFALKSAGTNSAIFSTKEGANAPQLVVTFGP